MHRAIFLDRDNTLIHNDGDLGDPSLVRLIQGVASAIASVRGLGYKVIVVSNQGGVARGKYTEADVDAVNQKLNQLIYSTSGVSIDRFYYCPYHPNGTVEKYRREHPWRKPQPGMLLQAAKDMDLDLTQSWMIGDQMRDVEAGAACGTRTVLLRADATVQQPPLKQEGAAAELLAGKESGPAVLPDFVARNLIEAVRIVAQQRRPDYLDESRLAEAAVRKPVAPTAPASPSPGPAPTPVSPQPLRLTTHSPASGPAATSQASPASPTASPPAPRPSPATPTPTKPVAAERPAPTSPPTPTPSPTPPASAVAVPASTPVSAPAPASAASSMRPESHAPFTPAAQDADVSEPHSRVPAEHTLRQILQEMRNTRRPHSEFSYLQVLAIILQMMAGVCLLGGLLLGSESGESFFRWVAVGLLFQLSTIAALLFRR